MSDVITVQGVVLSAMSVGDYDRRLVILTRERGKISAFAKGARRPNSPLVAASGTFVFGSFTLYEGRSSYTVQSAEILYHFAELALLQPEVYYGYYFLEAADYFGKEGIDGTDAMNLLYVTAKALENESMDVRLVRCAFELRLMTLQGLMPSLFACTVSGKAFSQEEVFYFSQENNGLIHKDHVRGISDAVKVTPAAVLAMQYIVSAPLGRLYSFTVSREVLLELERITGRYTKKNVDKKLKTLNILEMMVAFEK